MRVTYREEPCRSALNRVKGMPFAWSLNPYTGCVHRCTFCYVRGFELRADRPADDRYGRTVRVKPNIADVLRRELSRRSWAREEVTIGAATDPYQPAEGRYRLTRACIVELAHARTPISIITRGPMIWRDVDVLQDAAVRAEVSVNVSVPTLDDRVWRTTEPGTAPPRSGWRSCAGWSPPASARTWRSRRSCPGSRIGRSSSAKPFERRALRAHTISGRACSTSVPARESTFSRRSRGTGPRKPAVRAAYAGRSYLPQAETAP